MDSLNLSLSDSEDEDEVLRENLLRIANGTDDSDLDSSNTPTEALDEAEQGQGSSNPNDEPIIISDESDIEEDSTVIATISLKRGAPVDSDSIRIVSVCTLNNNHKSFNRIIGDLCFSRISCHEGQS